jgi:uncharacterized membrane-anchored protein YhcB (DUF1043 family)
MKIAIMQPYFLPYIGYFQLINHVDTFVIYDNIQFSKKGWFHRNRFLENGQPAYFSLPLKKDSDYLNVIDRRLSDNIEKEKAKILRKIEANYKKSPHFGETASLVTDLFLHDEQNLFHFILNSLEQLLAHFNINTKIIISSHLDIDHELKSQEKVLAICEHLKATEYINPIGGLNLYDKQEFQEKGINLKFLKSKLNPYPQYQNEHVPALSILDMMMFCDLETVKKEINNSYNLL